MRSHDSSSARVYRLRLQTRVPVGSLLMAVFPFRKEKARLAHLLLLQSAPLLALASALPIGKTEPVFAFDGGWLLCACTDPAGSLGAAYFNEEADGGLLAYSDAPLSIPHSRVNLQGLAMIWGDSIANEADCSLQSSSPGIEGYPGKTSSVYLWDERQCARKPPRWERRFP